MEIAGKKFLVVGGSGVLGRHLVQQLHQAGGEVLATATSNESATHIPNVAKVRLLLDLTKPESISILTSYLNGTEQTLDGIVLASGLVGFGPVADPTPAEVERLNRVNYLGPMQLVQELLPMLKAGGQESVVMNITGVVASMPMAGLSHYSASKTAIGGFLAAISKELRKDSVRIIDARPGHTETGLAGRPLFGSAPNFGVGLAPEVVVSRLIDAIRANETLLEAGQFRNESQ